MKPRFKLNWGKGAKQKVERLVRGGIDIDEPVDYYGYTLLHHAVDIGPDADLATRIESLEITLILVNKADVNVKDFCGRTPLMLAVASYNVDVVKELINRNAFINTTCGFNKTALHYAVFNPGTEIAQMLINKGAYVDCIDSNGVSPLSEAEESNNAVLVEYFRKQNEKRCGGSWNKIHNSVFWGDEKAVADLILKGGDIESRDTNGNTPLIVAVRSGKFRMTQLLLEIGAQVNASNNEFTALHWACKQGLADFLRLLLQYGANIFDRGSITLCFNVTVGDDCWSKTYKITSLLLSHLFDYGCEIFPISSHSEFELVHPIFKLFIFNHLKRSVAGLFFCTNNRETSSELICVQSCSRTHLAITSILMKKVSCKNLDSMMRQSNAQFCTDCRREIAMMKTMSLGKITLFDVLVRPVDYIANFISLENIHYILTNDKCSDNLLIYWGMIESKLEVLTVKKTFVESTQILFKYLKPVLPYDCIEIIIKYLSFDDMKYIKPIVNRLELANMY